MKRTIAWAIGSGVVVAAIVAACGSDVSDTTGSGGGTGGAGMSSSQKASSHASTGNTGGSGGSGGGDMCTMACDHLQQCGAGSCDQLPPQIPHDCSTAAGRCVSACVNDASCQDLQDAITTMSGPVIGCVVGCLGQGTGGGGQGGAGGGGQSCIMCGQGSCTGEALACFNNATCQMWLQCQQGCSDPTCSGACDTQFIGAESLYQPLYTCACTNCAGPCAAQDPCGTHPPAGTGGGSSSSTGP